MARARRRRSRRRNPMPTTGALYLSNGRRRRRSRRRNSARRASPFSRVIAKLNRRHRKRRNTGRRRNAVALTNRRRRSRKARRRTGARRRNTVRLLNRRRSRRRRNTGRRRNAVALTNGRRRNRKGRRRGYRRNTVRLLNRGRRRGSYRRRRNTAAAGGTAGTIFAPVEALVRKIPLVGKQVAPYVGPVAFGGLGLLGIHMALKYGGRFIPAQVKGYVAPVGYTIGGVLLGAAIALLPIPVSAKTKKTLAAAMVVGGAGVDTFRKLTGKSGELGDDVFGDEFGDGGLWQLGDGDMGAVALGDPELGALHAEYADAELADAYYSGHDLDDVEGEAALAGPRAWRRRFRPAGRHVRNVGACSRHAAKHGGRWAWLCKLVGFPRFQQIAAMEPKPRVAYIKKLREFAVSQLPAQQAAAAVERAKEAAHIGDYGALLYAGG